MRAKDLPVLPIRPIKVKVKNHVMAAHALERQAQPALRSWQRENLIINLWRKAHRVGASVEQDGEGPPVHDGSRVVPAHGARLVEGKRL